MFSAMNVCSFSIESFVSPADVHARPASDIFTSLVSAEKGPAGNAGAISWDALINRIGDALRVKFIELEAIHSQLSRSVGQSLDDEHAGMVRTG